MEVTDCLLSASRAVLELVEREWQPLSSGELEFRLDRAVEDILESELISRLEEPPPVPVVDLENRVQFGATGTPTAGGASPPGEEETRTPETVKVSSDQSGAVQYICALLGRCRSRGRLCGRAGVCLSQSVLLSLTLLSEQVSYGCVSRRFQLEKGDVHRIFSSFCRHVGSLKDTLVRWPQGREGVEALFPFCSLLGPADLEGGGVPQVLGILGHTLIPIRQSKGGQEVKAAWLHLELVCDHRGRFIHCRISRGSDVDRGVAVWDKVRLNPDLMPPGGCLLAGAGYPISAQVLTPYTGSVGPREEMFNRTLQKHLLILDQSVSRLRARFQRLSFLDVGSHERAVTVVLTCCVLHNVFLDMGQVEGRQVEGRQVEGGQVEGRQVEGGQVEGRQVEGGQVEGRQVAEEEEMGVKTAEGDGEGLRRRDAIADVLYRKVISQ